MIPLTGLNLRGDLAKLSDRDLAEHLAEQERALVRSERPWTKLLRFFDISYSWRGPVHARPFYKFWTTIMGGGRHYREQRLALYEIQDIHDEIRRRLGNRGMPGDRPQTHRPSG